MDILFVIIIVILCIYIIMYFDIRIEKMVINNKLKYTLWYNGYEDGVSVRKYVILW